MGARAAEALCDLSIALGGILLSDGQASTTLPRYEAVPGAELLINELETLAVARLRLLASCAGGRAQDVSCSCGGLLTSAESDAVAHFVLRLACCEALHLRTWFVNAETHLLALRWEGSGTATRMEALIMEGLLVGVSGLICKDSIAPLWLPFQIRL